MARASERAKYHTHSTRPEFNPASLLFNTTGDQSVPWVMELISEFRNARVLQQVGILLL